MDIFEIQDNKKDTIFVRCKRCNRVLKNEEARKLGYGKCCWKLHRLEYNNKNSLFNIVEKEELK